MGENTLIEKEANEATNEFIRIAQEIKKQKLSSIFSLASPEQQMILQN